MPKSRKRQRQTKKMVGGKFRFAKIFSKNPKGIEGEFKEADEQRKTFLQTLKKKYNELEKANENISIEVLVLNAKKKNKEEGELLNKQLKDLPDKLKNEIDNIYIEEEKRDLELKQLKADIKANTTFWIN
jgi:gas vesicle protein